MWPQTYERDATVAHALNNKMYLFFFANSCLAFNKNAFYLQNDETLKVKNTHRRWRLCSHGKWATRFSAQNKLE